MNILNYKKLISFITTLALVCTMCIGLNLTASATDATTPSVLDTGNTITDTDGNPAGGNTKVSATASIPEPSYTVTIPVSINFDNETQALAKYAHSEKDQYKKSINVSKSFTVSAANVDNLFDDLGKQPQIDVAITFNGLLMETEKSTIPYTVKKDSDTFTSGNVFCSFKNSSEVTGQQTVTGTVWINRTDITKTAAYNGTMTFTISIPDTLKTTE